MENCVTVLSCNEAPFPLSNCFHIFFASFIRFFVAIVFPFPFFFLFPVFAFLTYLFTYSLTFLSITSPAKNASKCKEVNIFLHIKY